MITTIAAWLGGVVTIITIVWRWILRPGHDVANWYHDINTKLESINRELKTNGGSTVKDSQNRLEKDNIDIKQSLKELSERTERDIDKLAQFMSETREELKVAINDTNHRLDTALMLLASTRTGRE